MVYDITSRLEAFSLNTVVSGFMEYTNKLIAIAKQNDGAVDKETIETVTILLAPFVPHIAEEIWEKRPAYLTKPTAGRATTRNP